MANAKTAVNADKTLFILKGKPDSLVQAEGWLQGKGWTVQSTDQLKDALPRIASFKPKFIIVCMDHPNSKVRLLPKLFEQAFQTKVIAYLESTAATSLASISGMEYVLYPPISGTAIDRMVSKLERDKRRKYELENQRANGVGKASLGTTASSIINVKGNAINDHDTMINSEQAKKALSQIMSGLGGEIGGSAEQASAKPKGGAAYMPNHSAPPTPSHLSHPAVASAEKNSARQQSHAAADNAAATAAPGSLDSFAKAKREQELETAKKKESKNNGWIAPLPLGKFKNVRRKATMLLSQTNKKKTYEENSGIVATAQMAIDETAVQTPSVPVLPLKECTDLICFFVNSNHHHGFVLCAIADNTHPLKEFVTVFKAKLKEFMIELDPEFVAGEPLEVSVKKVNFEEWSKQQADFLKKFVHLNRECAIAFFGLELAPPILHPSPRRDMVCLSLDEVHPDRQLGFDVFLHMPVNEKYFLYGRKGRLLTGKQKNRLVKRGIAAIHMLEKHVNDLHRYRLQAYLDQKITGHFETKDPKKAGSF